MHHNWQPERHEDLYIVYTPKMGFRSVLDQEVGASNQAVCLQYAIITQVVHFKLTKDLNTCSYM